jgi:hypothetical protein
MGCDDMRVHDPPRKKCKRCGSQREIDATEIVWTMHGEKLCLECLENWFREKFGKPKDKDA